MNKAITLFGRTACIPLMVFLLGPALFAADDTKTIRAELSTWTDYAITKSGWKSIVNETFGFSFQVPASSRIERHISSGGRFEYIRFQNYEFDDSLEPFNQPGRYWLEIFVYDHATGQKMLEPCPRLIPNPTILSKDGATLYRGDCRVRGTEEGESDREFCLCAQMGKFEVWIQAAESNKHKAILDQISRSFSFKTTVGK
ncbi:MAG: hypothetical protein HY913_09010 [Desulfomonile tiedjei]|nr:hypothetical protein [Desulfomonile tiedjei]